MKFPKNKANLFVVIRNQNGAKANIGAFFNLEDADDFVGKCEQEFLDKVGPGHDFTFYVESLTYYG